VTDAPWAAGRGVIYDHDGTLVDSLAVVVQATHRTLADFGHPALDAATIVAGMVLPTRPRLAAHSGEHQADRLDAMTAAYAAHALDLADQVTAYAGIPDLLARVDASGRPQAVVSNNQRRFVVRVLEHLQLARHFVCILGEEDLPALKPDARSLLPALATMRLPAGAALMIGDSPGDAQAARGAGARSIGVAWGTHDRTALGRAGFDRIVDRPADLAHLLGLGERDRGLPGSAPPAEGDALRRP
jgi:HAD superfamily hydrolase (TIGR01549 family)